ncbi:unnamed protein product [Adineta ricciae]|uniref:Uncharacterized protein n=1 Tax=Adineta ricciae TaxID=249248 RepID=A0A814FJB2_ADIRI|nr:unnamed protein product [Adineta ricciae]
MTIRVLICQKQILEPEDIFDHCSYGISSLVVLKSSLLSRLIEIILVHISVVSTDFVHTLADEYALFLSFYIYCRE